MDVDFWAARVHRHIPSVQSSSLGNSVVEDEVRDWFPCPYCYIEVELPVLCIHLQEEHYFNLKNAVCPICAASLGKDAVDHFTLQHPHSIKRRKKSQKSSNIVEDLRELSSFLGGNCLVPEDSHKGVSSRVSATTDAESKSSCLDEVKALKNEEIRQHVAFVHELLISTIV